MDRGHRSWASMVGVLFAAAAAACGQADSADHEESGGSLTQALSSNDRILGFEGTFGAGADWVTTSGVLSGSTNPKSQGSQAIKILNASSPTITSAPLSSLGTISSAVGLEVWLPANTPLGSWEGQVALTLNSPQAGLYNAYVGPIAFPNKPVGQFFHVDVPLNATIVQALSTKAYNDLTVAIALALPVNTQPAYLDGLKFSASSGGTGGSGAGGATSSGGMSASGAGGGSAGVGGAGAGGATASAGTSTGGGATTSGPCAFVPGTPATPSTSQFFIELPAGFKRQDVALAAARGSLILDDGVSAVEDVGGFARVTSVGATARSMLGVEGQVGDYLSQGRGIWIRDRARVHGSAITSGDITRNPGATIDGEEAMFSPSLQPIERVTWDVAFGSSTQGSCTIEPDRVQSLSVGSYGNITVKSRSRLKLSAGKYYFGSLTFEPQSLLDINNADGPVYVYVQGSFAFNGSQALASSTKANVLFGIAGTDGVNIQSPFRGIVVAPWSTVSLPTAGASGHVVSVFARDIIVHQYTTIHHQVFSPQEFCAGETSCGSFCPCSDAGECRSAEDCGGGRICTQNHQCRDPNGQCTSGLDCESGRTCNAVGSCVDQGCRSLDAAQNPCLLPENAGKSTACGVCPVCVPHCDGTSCGGDGCGGTCACQESAQCFAGQCLAPVVDSGVVTGPLPRVGQDPPGTDHDSNNVTAGNIDGTLGINTNGEATYRVPLVVPPGRGGLQPSLALTYSSAATNGSLGLGWALDGLSAVTRCNKTVAQDGIASAPDFSERDALCLNGQRLVVTDDLTQAATPTRQYRFELDTMARITGFFTRHVSGALLGPQYFRVESKDGQVLEYGNTADSFIEGLTVDLGGVKSQPQAQTWALNRVRDRSGNTIRVSYEKQSNVALGSTREYFVSAIAYGWHESEQLASAPALVTFGYHARDDGLSSWKNGVEIRQNHLLESVTMSVGAGAFRQYRLKYRIEGEPDGAGTIRGRSVLTDVTECARPPSTQSPQAFTGAVCKKPLHFDYSRSSGPADVGPLPMPAGPYDGLNWPFHFLESQPTPVKRIGLDLNGDGRGDLLIPIGRPGGVNDYDCNLIANPPNEKPLLGRCYVQWFVILSQPDGSYSSFETKIPIVRTRRSADIAQDDPSGQSIGQDIWERVCQGNGYVVDYNNDGADDLLETDCDDDGRAQKNYTVITFSGGQVVRKELPQIPYGPRGSTGPMSTAGIYEIDNSSPFTAAYALDIDGDGLKDVLECHSFSHQTLSPTWTLYRAQSPANAQGPFAAGQVVAIPNACRPSDTTAHTVLDVDGDGRDELILRSEPSGGERFPQRVLRIESDNSVHFTPTNIPRLSDNQSSVAAASQKPIDANGDGLTDFYSLGTGGLVLSISKGDGQFFTQVTPVPDVGYGAGAGGNSFAVAVNSVAVDVNGDGLQDLMVAGKATWSWLRSTGTTFVPERFSQDLPVPHNEFSTNPLVLEIDGDGVPDVLTPNFDQRSFPNLWQRILFKGPARSELSGVTDSLGAHSEIIHTSLMDPSVYGSGATCAYPQRCVRVAARRVAKALRIWDKPVAVSPRPAREVRYHYQDARLDLWRRTGLGYGRRDITEWAAIGDDGAMVQTAATAVLTDNATYDDVHRVFPYAQFPTFTSRAVTLPNGRFRETTSTSVPATLNRGKSFLPYLAKTTEEMAERSGFFDRVLLSSRVVTLDTLDAFGNPKHVTTTIREGDGTLSEVRTTQTSFEHENNPGRIDAWQINLPSTVTETSSVPSLGSDPAALKTRTVLYQYYSNGLQRTATREPFGGQELRRSTSYTRDLYGNVLTATQSNLLGDAHTTTTEYDDVGFAPTLVTNPLDQETQVRIDARFGLVTRTMDPNGLVMDVWYDDFGREKRVVDAGGIGSTVLYQLGNSSLPLRVSSSLQGGEDSVSEYDVLGRATHASRTGIGGSFEQSVDYDARGLPTKIERPHRVGTQLVERVDASYDNLGRPALVTYPDGGIADHCYSGHVSCERSPRGFTSCRVDDSQGRLSRSIDPPTSPNDSCVDVLGAVPVLPATRYTYGAFSQTRFIEDVSGGVKSIETDAYGRKKALHDPDLGSSTYLYDGFDDLIASEDASGNEFTLRHDALGRLTERVVFQGAGHPAQTTRFFWDGAGTDVSDALVGTLTRTQTPDQTTTTTHYDQDNGRLVGVDTSVGGETFAVATTYDEFGRVARLKYPRAPGLPVVDVDRVYDSHGHLIELREPGQQFGSGSFWSLDPIQPTDDFEQLRKEHLGNGVTTTREYAPAGRIRSIASTGPSAIPIQNLAFTVDLDGNVLSRTDLVHQQWEAFSHDHLDRLQCSAIGVGSTPGAFGPFCQQPVGATELATYGHDALGRLTQSPAGAYTYEAGVRHSPSFVGSPSGGTSYDYDANGNRISEASATRTRKYSYSPLNELEASWRAGSSPDERLDPISFAYDAGQQRVRKQSADSTTIYIQGIYERRSPAGGSPPEHVYIIGNGMRVVTQITLKGSQSPEVRYLHDDHLGSTQLVTDNTGQVVDERSYGAFGAPRNPLLWSSPASTSFARSVSVGFTGHEDEAELGLVNMRGREYDPRIGLFLQPDPIVQRPSFSQSLNRYAYVFNNPLRFNDPSGFETKNSSGFGGSGGSNGESGGLSTNQAMVDGHVVNARPGEQFRYSHDGQIYVNNGHGFSQMPNQTTADLASAMISAWHSADSPSSNPTNGGEDKSYEGGRASADTPGQGVSSPKGSGLGGPSNGPGTGASAGGGGSSDGGGSNPTPAAGPSSPYQDALIIAALLNVESPDAIRTDGTGNSQGIPGGRCETCEGDEGAQEVYLVGTAYLMWAGGEFFGAAARALGFGAGAAGDAATKGGTYLLRDAETGVVMRTGRTKNLARRALEHARDPVLADLEFEIVHETDNYAQQRGLEQYLHNLHDPPLNKVNPISPRNPNGPRYMQAARDFLGLP